MSLTTSGILTVADRIRVGYGVNDTGTSSEALNVNGTVRITEPNVLNANMGTINPPVSQSIIKLGITDYFPQIRSIRNGDYTDNTDLQFWTSGNNTTAYHAMTIKGHNAHGRVGIGTTDPSHALHVVGSGYFSVSVSQGSDARLKENIEHLDEVETHIKVLQLQPKSYQLIDRGNDDRISIGLIAQEVKPIFPELVCENDDGMMSLYYDKVSILMLQSIKQLQKQIDELKNENIQMKNEMIQLKK